MTGLSRSEIAYMMLGMTCLLTSTVVLGQATSPAGTGHEQFIGRTIAESDPPKWPTRPTAPKRAPNILVILTDDVGFGASSTFGGPVPTPTLDALAQNGLRYNNFNTAAICSATRAALLTGRDNHNVNMEAVTGLASGYPGYNSVVPKTAGTIAEILRQNGYATAATGKWHLTPQWEESQAGPFDNWPTGMGFDYFYGFQGADIDQWAPGLVEGTQNLEPPAEGPNYIFERDMTDHAIKWLQTQHQLAPDKPFFLYYAPGAAHAPHHAPKEWLEKFRGKFDQGWDVLRQQIFERQKAMGIIPTNTGLPPRPGDLPAWSSLTADQKKVATRLFEAFAAQLAFSDYQVSRMIDALRRTGQLDNTMIVFIQGDNGGSAEGGPRGTLFEQSFINLEEEDLQYVLQHIDDIGGPYAYNHFPAGWAWATNAPFQQYKQISSHFGGTRNGMVISWPAGIKQTGGLRSQFHHVSDIGTTILDVVGVAPPRELNGVPQQPLDGISMRYTFTQKDAPSQRRTQVFATVGNYGIYSDGWWAGTTPTQPPWLLFAGSQKPIDQRNWELYEVNKDFSQAHDLAQANRQKLEQMKQLFWAEAGRNHILPLQGSTERRKGIPRLIGDRKEFTYYPGTTRVPEEAAPSTLNRSYRIQAYLRVPASGANGVMIAQGGRFGGYSFYLKDGRPTFHYNAIGEHQFSVSAPAALTPGERVVTADFRSDGSNRGAGGELTISVDGATVARGRIDQTIGVRMSHAEGLDVGCDTLTPVTEDYSVSTSRFTGDLEKVVFTLK